MIRTLPDSNAFSLAYLPSYPCICLYLYILLRKQRLGVIKGNKYANARSPSQYLVCILIVCRAKKHNKRTQQLESKEYFFYQISNEISNIKWNIFHISYMKYLVYNLILCGAERHKKKTQLHMNSKSLFPWRISNSSFIFHSWALIKTFLVWEFISTPQLPVYHFCHLPRFPNWQFW